MKVLIVQGAGMELRGKADVEIFGPETLPEINAGIEAAAAALGMSVEIVQHNDEAGLVSALHPGLIYLLNIPSEKRENTT